MDLTITTTPIDGPTLPEQLGITKERAKELIRAKDDIIDSYFEDSRNNDPSQSNSLVAEAMKKVSALTRNPEELMFIGQVLGTDMGIYDDEENDPTYNRI